MSAWVGWEDGLDGRVDWECRRVLVGDGAHSRLAGARAPNRVQARSYIEAKKWASGWGAGRCLAWAVDRTDDNGLPDLRYHGPRHSTVFGCRQAAPPSFGLELHRKGEDLVSREGCLSGSDTSRPGVFRGGIVGVEVFAGDWRSAFALGFTIPTISG
jgi:hypothetical protein